MTPENTSKCPHISCFWNDKKLPPCIITANN